MRLMTIFTVSLPTSQLAKLHLYLLYRLITDQRKHRFHGSSVVSCLFVAAETCLPCHYKQWLPLLVKLFQLSAFMSQYLTGIKSHKLLLTSQYHNRTLKLSKEISTVCEISPCRHLCANCLENVGTTTSHDPMGLHGLLQGYLYFFFFLLCEISSSHSKEYESTTVRPQRHKI
jgi:hypothetical protein